MIRKKINYKLLYTLDKLYHMHFYLLDNYVSTLLFYFYNDPIKVDFFINTENTHNNNNYY